MILPMMIAFMLQITPPPHAVTLSWVNSPDTPNTNVYRQAGACGTSTPTTVPAGATLLTPTPVTNGIFQDTAVSGGQEWCYYVAATMNGALSTPLQSDVTIPLAPISNLTSSKK